MRECVCATLQAPWVLPGHLFCAQQGPGTLLHPAEGSGARTGQSEKTHSKSLAPRLLSELQGHICETGQRLLRNPPPPRPSGSPLGAVRAAVLGPTLSTKIAKAPTSTCPQCGPGRGRDLCKAICLAGQVSQRAALAGGPEGAAEHWSHSVSGPAG